MFEQKFNNLRAYIDATARMRGIILSHPLMSEPTVLDADLCAIKAALPESVRWRVMEHTLTVGHLYALYENYCENILSDWVNFLTERFSFAELPESLVESYQAGFARLSGILPSPRYSNLTIKSIINNYHSALEGLKNYQLDTECLTYHKNNLRWPDVTQIFSRCGINDINGWIASSNSLKQYFEENQQKIADQVEAKLSDLIQYRNDCSHGVVEVNEILGHDDLIDMITFIEIICTSLDQLILWKKLEILIEKGSAHAAGRATEVFRTANAFICTSEEMTYEVGQKIYVKKGAFVIVDEITSIQIDDNSVIRAVAKSGDELGMQCKFLPAKGSQLYILR
jgi:hypothetical protein